jgi:hypothetical protein
MLLPEVHVNEPVTISAAADLLGVTVDTIRYYEKKASHRHQGEARAGGVDTTRRR